jgi:hypothetical protein
VGIVERMVIGRNFATRERERREWLRSGRTRTGTTLLMVCLSLVCHYPRERLLCVRFQLGEIGVLWKEAGLLARRHQLDRLGRPVRPMDLRVQVGMFFVPVMLVVSVLLVMVQVVGVLSFVVVCLLDDLHPMINTGFETYQISADGNPTLCTSVVVPGRLPRAISVSADFKIHTTQEKDRVQHLIITLIRVHLFGTCRYKSIRTESNKKKTTQRLMVAKRAPNPHAARAKKKPYSSHLSFSKS